MPPVDIKFSKPELQSLADIITSYRTAAPADASAMKTWVANLNEDDAGAFFGTMDKAFVFTKQQHDGDNVIAAIDKMIIRQMAEPDRFTAFVNPVRESVKDKARGSMHNVWCGICKTRSHFLGPDCPLLDRVSKACKYEPQLKKMWGDIKGASATNKKRTHPSVNANTQLAMFDFELKRQKLLNRAFHAPPIDKALFQKLKAINNTDCECSD